MAFSHDMAHSLATMVELVNTAPETHGEEALCDLSDLADFLARRQVSGVGTLRRRDLDEVRAVRAAFHEVCTAPDREGVITRLNALLSGTRITPRLTEHDGHPLHIHYFAPGSSVAEHLAADCGDRPRPPACGERVGAAAHLRRSRLLAHLHRRVAQPLPGLLRQPYLREPDARGRVPGPPPGLSRAVPPAGGLGRGPRG